MRLQKVRLDQLPLSKLTDMLNRYLLISFCIFHFVPNAQKVDKKLQKQVETIVQGFNGEIGIYIKNLKNNKIVAINADTVFPTASQIKIPILIGVMDKISKGDLAYDQQFIYRDSLYYAGVDILGSFKQDEKIELGKLLMLMLTMSDNTASLWLQSLAGTGTQINELISQYGFTATRVNSRTPGRENFRTMYGWGQSTPREMAGFFEKIYKGEIISKAASDKMLRLLNRTYFDKVAISQLPPYATVFAKYGAVNQTRNEVLLVQGKDALYVFAIMSKNNKDESWKTENEAWEITRKISKLLWDYLEPKDKWVPDVNAQKFN
jgi:beta-lactamase class A